MGPRSHISGIMKPQHLLAGLVKSDEHSISPEKKDNGKRTTTSNSKKEKQKIIEEVSDTKTFKVNEGASSSKSHNEEEETNVKEDISFLKSQFAEFTPMLKTITENFMKSQKEENFIDSSDDNIIYSEDNEVEEGEIVDDLENFIKLSGIQVEKGPEINDKISQGVEEMMSKGICKETQKNLMDKYKTPSNCKRIEVVECNTEIFKKASTSVRIVESKSQEIQKCLSKGICAMVKAFNETYKLLNGKQDISHKQLKDIADMNTDAIALCSQTSHLMDMFRKMNFKREFKKEYMSICKEEDIKESLFGSNLPEKVKNLNETNKITKMMTYKKRKFPFLEEKKTHPQNKEKYQRREKTNFKQWSYKKSNQSQTGQKKRTYQKKKKE